MNEELHFKRGVVYSLMSYVFGEPDAEFYDFATNGELMDIVEKTLSGMNNHMPLNTQEIRRSVAEACVIGFDGLTALYGELTSPKMNYLYECNYHSRFSTFDEMADVAGFYKAFGVDFSGERPDLLSMELEFMNVLILKELKAGSYGETPNAEICIQGQKAFLLSHLGRWVEGFARVAKELKYYGGMSAFLVEWIDKECGYLGVKPQCKLYEIYGEPEYPDIECPATESTGPPTLACEGTAACANE